MKTISNVLLLVNHVQEGYLDSRNPDDVALREKILNFVDEARPHVDNIAWSYAHKDGINGMPFNIAKERSEHYDPSDLTLTNNDGKGLDSNFLLDLNDAKPDHVILVGVFFEACSAGTAMTIKENLGVDVYVPMDMTNPAEAPFEDHYRKVEQELSDKGIDVKSTSAQLLDALKNRAPEANATQSADIDAEHAAHSPD